jgi:hypothetical protein
MPQPGRLNASLGCGSAAVDEGRFILADAWKVLRKEDQNAKELLRNSRCEFGCNFGGD